MNKDSLHEGIDPKRIFVFYTPVSKKSTIEFEELFPKDWWWVGRGKTYPICNKENWRGLLRQIYRDIFGPPNKYTDDSSFVGPAETRESMKESLDRNFAVLKEKGVVKCYKIQDTYHPIPV
jgi:hypothetical protein